MSSIVVSGKNIDSLWIMIVLILLTTLHAFSCATIDASIDCDNSVNPPLFEGNACQTLIDEPGICKRILDCDVYAEGLRNKTVKYNSICRCGFIRFTEVICCPLNSDPSPSPRTRTDISTKNSIPESNEIERPSQAACREWKALDPAGIDIHVLSGVPAAPGLFAHMGALIQPTQSGGKPSDVIRCGSSLISEWYVLTAAHCVADELLLPKFVRLGVVVWNSNEIPPVDIEIEDMVMHPDYRYPLKYHDIALLKLRKKVEFDIFVRPACLYTDIGDVDSATPLVVIGWGLTNLTTRRLSDKLLMANLTTVPLSTCNKTHLNFGVSRQYAHGLDNGQYCAFDKELNADACTADSGGPLQLVENNLSKIVGIVSFGYLCGNDIPAVYARVAFYLDWIESVVWA